MANKSRKVRKTSFLPEVTVNSKVSRKPTKTFSQIEKLPYIPKWKTFHLEPLPEILDDTWKSELSESSLERGDLDIRTDLSLEDSLRKSLTLVSSLPNRRDVTDPDGKSSRHVLLEMNEFFVQMAEELRYLKSNLIKEKSRGPETNFQNEYPYYCADPAMRKIYKDIRTNESKVKEEISKMSLIENERNEIHAEIRSLISESLELNNKQISERDLPYYLLKNEAKKLVHKCEEERKESLKQAIKQKPPPPPPKEDETNFILKNIKLAKERTMYNSKCSLTDEEKLRLETLLNEIEEKTEPDPKEYFKSYENLVNNYDLQSILLKIESDEIPEETENFQENGFKLCKKDSKLVKNLDERLHDIQGGTERDCYQIEFNDAEEIKKPWRKQMMEKTLRDIDKNLMKIVNERTEETLKPDQPVVSPKEINIEDMRREYNETLREVKSLSNLLDYDNIETAELEEN